MYKTLIDLFAKQGGDRSGSHFLKAQVESLQRAGPIIFTDYKRKHCSSTDRCLERKNDEGKEKYEERSEKILLLILQIT